MLKDLLTQDRMQAINRLPTYSRRKAASTRKAARRYSRGQSASGTCFAVSLLRCGDNRIGVPFLHLSNDHEPRNRERVTA